MARGKAANAPAVFTLLKAAFIGCVVSVALIVIFAALMISETKLAFLRRKQGQACRGTGADRDK